MTKLTQGMNSCFGASAAVVHIQQTDGTADWHWPITPEYNAKGVIEPH